MGARLSGSLFVCLADIEAARQGRPDRLALALRAQALRVLRRRLPLERAEDAAHDLVLALLEKFASFTPSNPSAYVATCAAHLGANAHRDASRHNELPDLIDEAPSPEATLLQGECTFQVHEALARLSPGDRDLLQRHHLEEAPLEELRQQRRLSVSALYKQHERAKERLRQQMLAHDRIKLGQTRRGERSSGA